jgi:hypothetical protein
MIETSFFYSEIRNPKSSIGDQSRHYQDSKFPISRVCQFVELADGDVNGISGDDLTDLFTHLHHPFAALDNVDLLHRVSVPKKLLFRGDRGVGQEHQGLQVARIQNHVGHTSAMRPISSGFYFRMFQIALYHGQVLSQRSSFIDDILIENEGRNQNEADPDEKE